MTWRSAITLVPGDYLMDYHMEKIFSMWESHILEGGLYKVTNVRRPDKYVVDVEVTIVQNMTDDTTEGIGSRVFHFERAHSHPSLQKVIDGAILNGYAEKDPEWVETLKHRITLAHQEGNFTLTYDEEYLTIKIFTDKKQLFLFHASERFIYLTEEEATLFMRYTPKQLIGFELPVWFSHSHVRKCIQESVVSSHKGVILDITPMWETTGFIPFHRRWSVYKVKLYTDFIKRDNYGKTF